jgi:hypothetical protein
MGKVEDIVKELPPRSGILTPEQIAYYARAAGFRDDRRSNDPGQRHSELAVAIAIALAESNGDSGVVNSIGATGLWQIYPGGEQYLDPQANAEMAWNKYEGRGRRFTAWTTFTTKTYLVKLPIAEKAVKGTYEGGTFEQIGGQIKRINPLDFVGDIAKDLATFFAWITSGETWIRFGEVLGGAVLLLLALYLLFTHTSVGKDVRSIATKGAM